jgi:hypothetical protein
VLQAVSEELNKTEPNVSAQDKQQNICVTKYSAVIIVYIGYLQYSPGTKYCGHTVPALSAFRLQKLSLSPEHKASIFLLPP